MNNHTFFQHPDLIRILRVHENVMAIMINTLGRRAQAQSDAPQVGTGALDGEPVAKEKVSSYLSSTAGPVMYFLCRTNVIQVCLLHNRHCTIFNVSFHLLN